MLRIELAPNLGPSTLGNSRFLGQAAGRLCRHPMKLDGRLVCRSRREDAPRCSLYAKPRILHAPRRGS